MTDMQRYDEISRRFQVALRADHMVSLYMRRGMFYLSRRFFRRFHSAAGLEITVAPDGGVALRETARKKRPSQFLQSRKACQWICERYGVQENAMLAFFYDAESGDWRGQPVPQVRHAYGWDRIDGYVDSGTSLSWEDRALLGKFRGHYACAMDRDEVKAMYALGAALAERTYEGPAGSFWDYKTACIFALLKELAREQRRICGSRGILSLETEIRAQGGRRFTIMDRVGSCTDMTVRMELADFIGRLDIQERLALRFLQRFGIPGLMGYSFGIGTRERMLEAHSALKRKACEFWGCDYINSLFVRDVAFIG